MTKNLKGEMFSKLSELTALNTQAKPLNTAQVVDISFIRGKRLINTSSMNIHRSYSKNLEPLLNSEDLPYRAVNTHR